MASELLTGIGKFITGAVIGALALAIYNQTTPQPPTTRPVLGTSISSSEHSTSVSDGRVEALSHQLDVYMDISYQLENNIQELNARLTKLEKNQNQYISDGQISAKANSNSEQEKSIPEAENSQSTARALSIATLVEAGIDQQQASSILDQQGKLDMLRLELRDQAIRDGNLGSKEYLRALRDLNANAPNMRDELGDGTYDRYLYATGQKNRVFVTSVISGSAADQAGIRQGDAILSYDDKRIFNWPELRKATTLGYRGEYVTVNIQRDNETLSLLLPRGPLGVRMATSSKPPLEYSGY